MIMHVVGLVQEATDQQVYPLSFPSTILEPTDTRITMNVVTGSKRYAHDGDINLSNQTLQFTVFGKHYPTVIEKMNLISRTLSGYRGEMVRKIVVEGIGPDDYNQDSELYQKSMDFDVLYTG